MLWGGLSILTVVDSVTVAVIGVGAVQCVIRRRVLSTTHRRFDTSQVTLTWIHATNKKGQKN
jgi:citrate lyase gamma subunit